MNREKSSGKGMKLHYKLIIAIVVLLSILIIACPPLEEDPYGNTIVKSVKLDSTSWMEILNDIQVLGMPVNLDLSGCTVPDYGADVLKRVHEDGTDYSSSASNPWDDYIQFNPLPGFPYGKELIRSIILPKAATMIVQAIDIKLDLISEEDVKKSAFRHFTNLRSVTGENIRLIGNLAFIDCKTLEEAKFDRAAHVMQYAFSGCTGLKEVRFEYARDILPGAFENCTNLQSVVLPYVGVISQYAFKNCTSLTEVSFPYATVIGGEAFKNCTSLRIARFHANPNHSPTIDHPLKPWYEKNGNSWTPPSDDKKVDIKPPCSNDSVIFHPYAFRGCSSLETLDVRNAWNVFFFEGVLADIGTHLDLHLFDDAGISDGGKSFGHPQIYAYLGGVEYDVHHGDVTLSSITIIAPVVPPPAESQITKHADDVTTGIFHDIRGRYGYYFEDKKDADGKVLSYNVTVRRVPALQ